MNNNILIGDFDRTKRYYATKGSSQYKLGFDTYDECMEWIKGQQLKTSNLNGYHPTFGALTTMKYTFSFDELMNVIEQIGEIELPNDVDDNGNRIYVDGIYPVTFMRRDEKGNFMFRFNGFSLHKSQSSIGCVYDAIVEVLNYLKTENYF
ncbi:hypothetical protein BPT24_283 [Tenacibaculum phage pT24]|uniref:Uncharacterized protein n=1 Tax=Tenacibaculum phage pT24 TaxID=1880590 RepID=A0A1B4XX68_9CAUD|nr:hypothetical protein HYP10_gp245 [Tenacibaculum phage pT24]BAV39400.1 hypothetical protein BPT24_283 [Tenacibaculum phage pT24]